MRCGPSSPIVVESPPQGAFIAGDDVSVRGRLRRLDPTLTTLELGELGVELGPAGEFDSSRPLDPSRLFQPLVLRAANGDDETLATRRVTVVRGTPLASGERSPSALVLRLSDAGLDAIEEEAAGSLADTIDIEGEVLDSNPIYEEDFCIIPNPFGGCAVDLDVEVDVERVEFDKVKVDLDARKDFLRVDVIVKRLDIHYDSDGVDCKGRIRAEKVTASGDYVLAPHPAGKNKLDANLVNDSLAISFTDFDHDFTGGACDSPVIGDVIDELLDDVEPEVEKALRNALEDPDGDGRKDALVAQAIEDSFAVEAAWEAVAESLGGAIDSQLMEVVQDRQGLTFVYDAAVNAQIEGCSAPTPAAWQTASLAGPLPAPLLEDTTPAGLDYDAAISLSAGLFDQLLAVRTACGLLASDLDEIDLGTGNAPLTAGLLTLVIPELAVLDPATPMRIELRPTLAPAWHGEPGGAGEPMNLEIGHLWVRLVDGSGASWLDLALDLGIGLDVDFGDGGASLEFALGALPPESLGVTVLRDRLGVDADALAEALVQVLPFVLPATDIALGPFALPSLLDVPLAGIETAARPGSLGLYLDLAPETP